MAKAAKQISNSEPRSFPDGIITMSRDSVSKTALLIGDGGNVPDEIMILPAGDFIYTRDGRAVRNPDPEKIVAAYNEDDIEIMVDISHASVWYGSEPPAQGWLKSMSVKGGAVWAMVEWTDLGADVLKRKHYRYISPAFTETPESELSAFVSIALVNQPAMVMPSVASVNPNKIQNPNPNKEKAVDDEQLKKLREVYDLADDASVEDILAAAEAAREDPAPETNPESKGSGEVPNLDDYVPRADYDAAVEKLAEFEAGEGEAPTDDEVGEAVDAAVETARIAPASRDHYVQMCSTRKGFDAFKKFAKSAPKIVSAKTEVSKGKIQTTGANLSESEIKVCRSMGIKPDDYIKTNKGAQ